MALRVTLGFLATALAVLGAALLVFGDREDAWLAVTLSLAVGAMTLLSWKRPGTGRGKDVALGTLFVAFVVAESIEVVETQAIDAVDVIAIIGRALVVAVALLLVRAQLFGIGRVLTLLAQPMHDAGYARVLSVPEANGCVEAELARSRRRDEPLTALTLTGNWGSAHVFPASYRGPRSRFDALSRGLLRYGPPRGLALAARASIRLRHTAPDGACFVVCPGQTPAGRSRSHIEPRSPARRSSESTWSSASRRSRLTVSASRISLQSHPNGHGRSRRDPRRPDGGRVRHRTGTECGTGSDPMSAAIDLGHDGASALERCQWLSRYPVRSAASPSYVVAKRVLDVFVASVILVAVLPLLVIAAMLINWRALTDPCSSYRAAPAGAAKRSRCTSFGRWFPTRAARKEELLHLNSRAVAGLQDRERPTRPQGRPVPAHDKHRRTPGNVQHTARHDVTRRAPTDLVGCRRLRELATRKVRRHARAHRCMADLESQRALTRCRARLDIAWAVRRCLRLDLLILCKTVPAVMHRDGAY